MLVEGANEQVSISPQISDKKNEAQRGLVSCHTVVDIWSNRSRIWNKLSDFGLRYYQ